MPTHRTCFVVGPIGEAGSTIRQKADWLLKGIIRPVLETEELGYTVKRADDDADPGSITNALINDVIHSDLVVADLTGFNPNAFYELGIRHAVQKPTIHIIAEAVRLPFDNLDQRTIFIDLDDFDSFQGAKEQLRNAALAAGRDGYTVTNPVTRAGGIAALQDSSDPKDKMLGEVIERLSRLEQEHTASGIIGQGPFATMSEDEAALLILQRLSTSFERGSLASELAKVGGRSRSIYLDKAKSRVTADNVRARGLLEDYLSPVSTEASKTQSEDEDSGGKT